MYVFGYVCACVYVFYLDISVLYMYGTILIVYAVYSLNIKVIHYQQINVCTLLLSHLAHISFWQRLLHSINFCNDGDYYVMYLDHNSICQIP